MNSLSLFLKKNKKQKKDTTYAATKSLTDENGKPLLWTIRPITSKIHDQIREDCMIETPVRGKNTVRTKFDSTKYIAKVISACVVEPNLYSKELQDSYGVMTPEDLVREMVDDPGEYMAFSAFVNQLCGLDESMNDKVEEAKN
ncbi:MULTISPECIES: phage tail assembly chaperone [Clostridiaceae]|uniref:Phage XkdN-like protein n=1 Tax=Clostridium facile TaxID=2763035 RepID=A0ABR7INQ6_9CLOT|nr:MULTISPECIES: hypothetical protein [Clostridiaceae]MBC5786741.1 hypothetical protein [Clostridium facile]